jgi:hypothetical protein
MHRSVLGPVARKTHVFDVLEICPNGSIEGRMIQRMDGRYGLQQDDFFAYPRPAILYRVSDAAAMLYVYVSGSCVKVGD